MDPEIAYPSHTRPGRVLTRGDGKDWEMGDGWGGVTCYWVGRGVGLCVCVCVAEIVVCLRLLQTK